MKTQRIGGIHTGFTLVELMVALAISAVLVLAVNAALSMGMRLSRREEGREAFENRTRQLIGLLRTEVSGIYFPGKRENKPPPFRFERIDETGEWVLSFYTTAPAYYAASAPGGCARVTYEYRRPDGQDKSGVLIRREELASGEEVIGQSVSDVVAERLSAFTIDVKNDEQASQETNKLPRTIELSIAWAASPGQIAPAGLGAFSAQLMIPANAELPVDDGADT